MERRSDTSPTAHEQPYEQDEQADGAAAHEPVEAQDQHGQHDQPFGDHGDPLLESPTEPEAIRATPDETTPPVGVAQRGATSPHERSARTGTLALTLALVSALLVSGLLLALSNVTRQPTGDQQERTTAQATPSPTATVFPTPTAEPGFQLYIDHADGFLIQYPTGWVASTPSSGIEFTDGSNELGYEVQVILPDPSIAQNSNGAQSNYWITYEFNILTQRGFILTHQLGCPEPYTPPITIGKVRWTCGVAFVSLVGVTPTPSVAPSTTPGATATVTATPGATANPTASPNPSATATSAACASGTCIQVVVLATVYQGRPFIINLLTSSDRFAAGNIEYFQPMLNSFEFLPTAQ